MTLRDFALFLDENVQSAVAKYLRKAGFDVTEATAGANGLPNIDLLREATKQGRVVITHDSDFGSLAILAREPYVGIVYLRPGHIGARFTIDTIRTILQMDLDLQPPFIGSSRTAWQRGSRSHQIAMVERTHRKE